MDIFPGSCLFPYFSKGLAKSSFIKLVVRKSVVWKMPWYLRTRSKYNIV